MKGSEARLCPSCGARNRPQWEFCARCGEALDKALPAAPAAPEAPAAASGRAPSPRGLPWGALAITLLAIPLVYGAWRLTRAFTAEAPALAPLQSTTADASPPTGERVVAPAAAKLDDGRRLLASGQRERALPLLREAADALSEDATAQLVYGRALWDAGQREEGLLRFERAARLDGSSAGLRTELARALEALGRSDEARSAYEQALRQEPTHSEALIGLARLHIAAGRAREALPLLRQATASQADPAALALLGVALERGGDPAAALATYRDLVDKQPDLPGPRALLAEALAKAGQRSEAQDLLREGLRRDPQSALLQRALGSLLERDGKPLEAAQAYREYVRLAPEAGDAAELTARAARLAGGAPKGS